MNTSLLSLVAVSTVCLLASHAAGQAAGVQRVHDPCIIKHRDTYYVFSTGRGIPMRRSTDLRAWERIADVLDRVPDWARREIPQATGLWAPDISFFQGKYHLYYSVSTFGGNRSCIGLAVNETLDPQDKDYRWIDQGKVLESRPTDDFNGIDPNVAFDADGRPWLAFGSFWSGIKLRRLDERTGKLSSEDSRHYSLAARPAPHAIEAPFIIRKNGYHYLFVSFDLCCRGVNSTYKIMVGRAREITGPYVDRDGKSLLEGGGTLVLQADGRYRGPGHNAILSEGARDWLVYHCYDAEAGGVPTMQIRLLHWSADGWPLPGGAPPRPYNNE